MGEPLGGFTIYKNNSWRFICLGEPNFSDHGAKIVLGASALMQGLADGYLFIPLHRRLCYQEEIKKQKAYSQPTMKHL